VGTLLVAVTLSACQVAVSPPRSVAPNVSSTVAPGAKPTTLTVPPGRATPTATPMTTSVQTGAAGVSAVQATPTPRPVLNKLPPDADLGHRFFGQVELGIVPGGNSQAPASTRFSYGDRIGLRVDTLEQDPVLPFSIRAFYAAA